GVFMRDVVLRAARGGAPVQSERVVTARDLSNREKSRAILEGIQDRFLLEFAGGGASNVDPTAGALGLFFTLEAGGREVRRTARRIGREVKRISRRLGL
ncbi:MAG: hypothetical protein ACPGWS_10095, partial [Solirubrobacterales bacterium]